MEMSTRDAAIIVWALIIGAFLLSQRNLRDGFVRVLRAAARPKLLGLAGVFFVYAGAEVALLHRLGLWNSTLLKTTLLWFVFTGIVAGFKGLSGDPGIRAAVKEGLGIAAAAAVLFGTATFSFPAEFFVVGFASVIGTLVAVSSTRPEDAVAHRFLSRANAAFGILVAVSLAASVYAAPPKIKLRQLLGEFLLPVALSLLFVPAAKGSGVLANYEWLFGHLRGLRTGGFRSRAALFMYLGLSQERVLEFGRARIWQLHGAATYGDVRSIIISDSEARKVGIGHSRPSAFIRAAK